MTQAQSIVEYMQEHGSITRLEALYHCGCINLPGRIFDLRDRGYQIKSKTIAVRKANGDTAHVAQYRLEDA